MKSGRGIVVGLKHVVVLAVVVCGASLAFGGPNFFTDYASFDAASNTVLTEDFEGLATNMYDKALASFTSNGITYAGVGNNNVWVASPGYTNFGVNPTTSSILTATGDEDFTALMLNSSVTALGFDTYLNGYGPALIEVWSGATLLDTYELDHPADTIGFFGVTAWEGITMIRWTTTNGKTVNTGIDNVVTGAVVPAPGALMLGSLGAALVGWLRRRRTM